MAETVRIERLGHRGDGVTEDGLFVPFTLPGERISVDRLGVRGRAMEIVETSPQRVEPACPHFGSCGGCALQHMHAQAYRGWKRDLVVTALRQRGLAAPVEELVPFPSRSRRRAVLAARRTRAGIKLGFHERQSRSIVGVSACPVLRPELEQALPGVARLIASAPSFEEEASVTLLQSEAGLDVSINGPVRRPEGRSLSRMIEGASSLRLARLSIRGEPVARLAEPVLTFGGARVVPPPGAFVQAVAEAEDLMGALVAEGIGPAKRMLDLFAGIGTFALRLAGRVAVHAVDGERAALDALARGARGARGLRPVTTEARDLFRRPLSVRELGIFDAVVLDPPRAGADAQFRMLAASAVPRIVAVSCNPATFARDARLLVDGGYRLQRVVPIDQFLYSPHVELVALFAK